MFLKHVNILRKNLIKKKIYIYSSKAVLIKVIIIIVQVSEVTNGTLVDLKFGELFHFNSLHHF